ncbi:nuclear transport factor 2 family protein [Tamlana sp. I1]|uniref:nuclear transport factor 2 family protein n=1 Tax=Tamlana sp. I1 TaxID=2762061 RepID=UPI0018906A9B|nr:nuclear transport factor 2 family protein [Tamlana sp. I1]
MTNQALITEFYTAFAAGNAKAMTACYHEDIVFQDPVFGVLKGQRAVAMWKMLLAQKKSKTKITFNGIEATEETGKANWIAEYVYGAKKRNVINKVNAHFKFKDGKIIEHIDTFNLWTWTKQAMGFPGYLLGWTSFMKNKIQQTTNKKLDAFLGKN